VYKRQEDCRRQAGETTEQSGTASDAGQAPGAPDASGE
jgi:hypothetical protein